jgi:hypothetical protein
MEYCGSCHFWLSDKKNYNVLSSDWGYCENQKSPCCDELMHFKSFCDQGETIENNE